MKRKFIERAHCKDLIKEFDLRYPKLKKQFFHVPNGEARDARTGALLKAMGVRAGVSDYFLAVPAQGYCGLFIEMKASEKDKPSKLQQEFLNLVALANYKTLVCCSAEIAMKEIMEYLKKSP